MNALLTAALAGDLDGVQEAVAKGVSIDSTEGIHGNTALMLAAFNRHLLVVTWLIEHGASVVVRGRSPRPGPDSARTVHDTW